MSLNEQINSTNFIPLAMNLGIFDETIFKESKNRKIKSSWSISENVSEEKKLLNNIIVFYNIMSIYSVLKEIAA